MGASQSNSAARYKDLSITLTIPNFVEADAVVDRLSSRFNVRVSSMQVHFSGRKHNSVRLSITGDGNTIDEIVEECQRTNGRIRVDVEGVDVTIGLRVNDSQAAAGDGGSRGGRDGDGGGGGSGDDHMSDSRHQVDDDRRRSYSSQDRDEHVYRPRRSNEYEENTRSFRSEHSRSYHDFDTRSSGSDRSRSYHDSYEDEDYDDDHSHYGDNVRDARHFDSRHSSIESVSFRLKEFQKRYLLEKEPGIIKTIEIQRGVQFSGLDKTSITGTSIVTVSGTSKGACELGHYDLLKRLIDLDKDVVRYSTFQQYLPSKNLSNYFLSIVKHLCVVLSVNPQQRSVTVYGPPSDMSKAVSEIVKHLRQLQPKTEMNRRPSKQQAAKKRNDNAENRRQQKQKDDDGGDGGGDDGDTGNRQNQNRRREQHNRRRRRRRRKKSNQNSENNDNDGSNDDSNDSSDDDSVVIEVSDSNSQE